MIWPIPVASAAPRIPISGKIPIPNIISGSKIILDTHPTSIQSIDVFIRPTDWKIFSKQRPAAFGTAKIKTIFAYSVPISMIDLLSVNMARKGAVIAMQTTARTNPWIILKSVPNDAVLSAVLCFSAPRKYAIVALIPIANPITTALTRFCNGNTKESAVIASSLMRATK